MKCKVLFCVTTVSAWICNLSVMAVMYLTSKIFGIDPKFTGEYFSGRADAGAGCYFFVSVLVSGILAGILSFCIGMISAAVGWKKHSVMTTVICSILIVCFVPNLIAGASDYMIWVMLAVSVCFILSAGVMYRVLLNGIEKVVSSNL